MVVLSISNRASSLISANHLLSPECVFTASPDWKFGWRGGSTCCGDFGSGVAGVDKYN